MMQISPLQLESYQFTRIDLSVREGEVSESDTTVRCELDYAVNGENPRRYRVNLKLFLDAEPKACPPYAGAFEVVGYFKISDLWPAEKITELVSVNGPSLLYGAVREMIANLTSRFPHGSIQLPTVRFSPMDAKAVLPQARKPARKVAKGKG